MFQQIEIKAYPDTLLKRYLDTNKLSARNGFGLFKYLFPVEDEIFEKTNYELKEWRKKYATSENIFKFDTEMINKATMFLGSLNE